MEVLIAGGGIGGLAAALFLHAKGIGVRVCEAAQRIEELGVGINIQPHAVRELAKLGLMEILAARGNSCLEWAFFNRFGQEIWREPRGSAAGHDWPQISIHRGRLQGILLDAARVRIGPDRIIADRRLIDFSDDGNAVHALFMDHDGVRHAIDADLLIGADGIHSATRGFFYPEEGPPVFSDSILWRGVTRAVPSFAGNTMTFAGTKDQKLITYPITPAGEDGRALINWIAEVHSERMLNREDWNRKGDLSDFLPLYQDWTFPWMDVPALIRGADKVYEYPMVDRDPLPRWSFGRVTLMGDAAHPVYPIGANGASQAIRDASALAECLASTAAPVESLLAYEAERLQPTTEVVLSNRQLGPEQIMVLAEERAPNGFKRVEDIISRQELETISARYRTITWADKKSGGKATA